MAEITTMKELSERPVPDHQLGEFQALVAAVRKNYPGDWETWEVRDVSGNELFGEHISSRVEAKLRFAIPTDDIREIFFRTGGQLSERGYKEARRKLLSWPLGRAILYSPHAVVTKIHPSPLAYEKFMNTVAALKPKINPIRGSSADRTENTPPDRGTQQEKSTSQAPETPTPKTPKNTDVGVLANMLDLLTKQTQAIDNLAKRVDTIDQLSRSKDGEEEANEPDEGLNQFFDSEADNTSHKTPWQAPPLSSPGPSHMEDLEKTLRQTIVDTQRELVQLSSVEQIKDEDSWDFNPVTSETEPKITKADPKLVEQAIECQRLGDDSWKNVRYADVQQNFQATPAFCTLKVNCHLAVNTPNWQSLAYLEKTDLTLGAIVHGLLQQRQALKDAYKYLSEPAKMEVKTKLLGDSKFRKITDQLLQYSCGRRAETIQARRETYKSTNKVLNDMLHDIPPSATHLFSEEKLAEVMKDQGGALKFFLKSTTKNSQSRNPTSSSTPEHNRSTANWKSKKPYNHNQQTHQNRHNKQTEYAKNEPQEGEDF